MASREDRQSIARRCARPRRSVALALGIVAAGCAAPQRPPAPPPLDGGAAAQALAGTLRDVPSGAAADALVVRLAFDARADLDLYVTDPLTETVYFALSPTRSGGTLRADLTCGDPAPRVETVVFAAPLRGRYRIGVDHPRSCGDPVPAAFAVQAEHGGRRWESIGAVAPRRFEAIVLELDLE